MLSYSHTYILPADRRTLLGKGFRLDGCIGPRVTCPRPANLCAGVDQMKKRLKTVAGVELAPLVSLAAPVLEDTILDWKRLTKLGKSKPII